MAFRSLRFLFLPSIRPPTAKERRSKAHGLSKRRAHAFPAYERKGKNRTKKAPKQNCFEAEGGCGSHERNARLRGEAGIVSGVYFFRGFTRVSSRKHRIGQVYYRQLQPQFRLLSNQRYGNYLPKLPLYPSKSLILICR